jgi:hypothetical protein
VFDHSNDLEENSNLITIIKTPKNLSTPAGVVAAFVFKRRFSNVILAIVASWLGGNINRK